MTAGVSGVLARSYLFAPGSRKDLLEKVFDAGADAVVLDLEDSVAESEKEQARRQVAEALSARAETEEVSSDSSPQVWVRINALGGPHWRRDVEAVLMAGLGGLRVPKAESVAALNELDEALESREAALGMASGTVAVTAAIESARGVLGAQALAGQSRVDRLAFGAADFVADIGADGRDEQATLYARSHLVLASRAAGALPPIAPVFTQLADDDGLERTSQTARCLGFFGRSCIHPRQLPVVHRVFTPSSEEVAWAKEVVEALDRSLASGEGGTMLSDGSFVDEAVARRARRVVALTTRSNSTDARFEEVS